MLLQSFAPIINKDVKTLVIGTMPGSASLEAQEYYAHKCNIFWKIISKTFCNGAIFETYEEKLDCLLTNRIGLWDSLQSCSRPGSLDSDIKDTYPNNFKKLFDEYGYCRLLFNGQKAYEFFKRYNKEILEKTQHIILPSTSPANAAISFDLKLEKWKTALISK